MRLFKRTSTSPQLLSAISIPRDSTAIGSFENIKKNNNEIPIRVDAAKGNKTNVTSEIGVTPTSHSFPAHKGITTWGKKVGRKWSQMKRSDCTEFLPVSGRIRCWSPNRKILCDTKKDQHESCTEVSDSSITKSKPISRVESLINLFRSSERDSRDNINDETSTSDIMGENKNDVTNSNYYKMDKSFSEGALRNVSFFKLPSRSKNEIRQKLKNQMSSGIKNFPEQGQIDHIVNDQEVLKNERFFACDTLNKIQTNVQNNGKEIARSNVDLNENGVNSNRKTRESGKVNNVKKNLLSVRTSPRERKRQRSVNESGLEDLMCTLKLRSEESDYHSDVLRANTDSPDGISVTSENYEGIDLSLSTSKMNGANTGTIDTVEKSVKMDRNVISDGDDTDSCDEDTFEGFTELQITPNLVLPSDVTVKNSPVLPLRNRSPNNLKSPSAKKKNELLDEKVPQKTPSKLMNSRSTKTMSPGQRTRPQNQRKSGQNQVTLRERKVFNSSVLNLLENAASPSQDSPPASKINFQAPLDCVQYYSPKRSRSNMESDGIETTPLNPPKKLLFATPVTPPLVRREPNTMKLPVPTFNFEGNLGDTWGEPILRSRNIPEVWSPNEATKKLEDSENFHETWQDTSSRCEIIGALTKSKKNASPNDCQKNDSRLKITGMRKFQVVRKRSSILAARTRGITSLTVDLLTVTLEKGASKKLGFTIVGGADSNKGRMGIFVKDVMTGGQAAEEGTLRAGDEILAVNGQSMEGLTHAKALQLIKVANAGKLIILVGRRDSTHKRL